MVSQAVVVVSMQTTTSDANQITRATLRPAEFDAGPQIYDSIAECSAQFFYTCVSTFESLYVRLEPVLNVSYS